jgi:hypothetical protein
VLVTVAGPLARRTTTAAVVLVVVGALTACSSTPGAEDPSPVPSSPSEPSATPAPTPTPTGTPIVVTGTVTEGVEQGCLVLIDDGTTYLLLGAEDQLAPGAEMTVEGRLADDVMTTCQQGTPLRVESVRPR